MVNVQITVSAQCDVTGIEEAEEVLAAQVRPAVESLGASGSAYRVRLINPQLMAVRIDHDRSKGSGPPADHDYEKRTFDELYAIAQAREIPGRSHMSKAELVVALSETVEV